MLPESASVGYPPAKDDKHHLLLEAYGYRWYRVGGLDYLLKRSEIETPARD
jgi:maltose alpha-D-glucosyltransferase/alpha-amylase